jgi:hypothetical protein
MKAINEEHENSLPINMAYLCLLFKSSWNAAKSKLNVLFLAMVRKLAMIH